MTVLSDGLKGGSYGTVLRDGLKGRSSKRSKKTALGEGLKGLC